MADEQFLIREFPVSRDELEIFMFDDDEFCDDSDEYDIYSPTIDMDEVVIYLLRQNCMSIARYNRRMRIPLVTILEE